MSTKSKLVLRPDPADYSDKNAFVSDCISARQDEHPTEDVDQSTAICISLWKDKSKSVQKSREPVITKTFVSKDTEGLDFVLSDATVDRYGDVIMQDGWLLENFNKNPIALFNHNPSFPIGKWQNLHVTDGQLRGTLKMAPEGTSERIDELHKLIDAGILRAVSVGFAPIDYEEYKSGNSYGYKYTKSELVETSLVSIPANPNALAVIKGLKISDDTQKLIFGKHADRKTRPERRGPIGKHAETSPAKRDLPMAGPLAQRIIDTEQRLVTLRDQLTTHMATVDDENPTDEQTTVTEELSTKIEAQEKSLASLKKAEAKLAIKAVEKAEDDNRSGLVVHGQRPFAVPAKKLRPADYIWRALTVQVKHHHEKGRRTMVDVLKETYGECEATHALMNVVTRSTTVPATTTTAGWAQELVTIAIGDFFGLLLPTSIYAQLSALGGRFTFGPNGVLMLPTRSSTPTIGGAFVGQGAPIPVKQGAFAAVTMVPKKVGVISTFTREIAEHSTPSIEQLIRDAIVEDTSVAIDAVLMDANPATAIRPPGLQNGATAVSSSGATADLDKLVADLKSMTNALFSATNGNVRIPVWIMTPGIANNVALTSIPAIGNMPFREEVSGGRLAGYPIIKSTSSVADSWFLMDAADFISATGDTPRFDVSDQAVLHFEDTSPADIITGGSPAGGSSKSLWQTDSIGIRMLMDMNWAMRRTGMVLFMSNLQWSP